MIDKNLSMLTNINILKDILQKHSLVPRKSLGQNFLINESILQKIIETAELSKKDIIIEVGPGIGTLTKEVAKYVKKNYCYRKRQKTNSYFKRKPY